MIRSRAPSRHFLLPAATLSLLSILGSCGTTPVKRNAVNASAERARPQHLTSAELLKSTQLLSSPEYSWLQKSIENTGKPVTAADYPWQVGLSIRFRAQSWRCGGTLISRSYILTAAHCLDGAVASDLGTTIRIGLNGIDVFHGSDTFGEGTRLVLDPNWPVTFHPQWKKTGQAFAWDAALLKLATPVAVVPAPAGGLTFTQGVAVTSGWGDYDVSNQPSPLLRAVAVPVVTNDNCRTSLPEDKRAAVGSYTLCAVSKVDDACARDSGGPLVAGPAFLPQIIGIVSWGLAGSCGAPGPTGLLVGGYTRVSEIAPWIKQSTGDPTTVTDRTPGATFIVRPRTDM